MCGRIFVKPGPAMRLFLESFGIDTDLPELNNLAPTEQVPVLTRHEEQHRVGMMRWWLHPAWSPDPPNQKYAMFNARIETVLTSRAFKAPIAHRRGIVLASGFVEWKTEGKLKLPHYCEPTDEAQPLALAAIWEVWQEQVWSCAIVTQPADARFSWLHDRMPLSLTTEQAVSWMAADQEPKALLASLAGQSVPLRIRQVEANINNARHKVPPAFIE